MGDPHLPKSCMASVLLLLVSSLGAQGVSVVLSPAVVPVGGTLSIAVTEANGVTLTFPSSCNFEGIVQGSPSGPIVDGPFCLLVLTNLGPCQTSTSSWGLAPNIGPGLYYVRVSYYDPSSSFRSEYFPFHIGLNEPRLTSTVPARIGQSLPLSLFSPSVPSAYYAAAASFTTNTGFQALPNLFVSLDPDFLFFLSFPTPDPLLFTNFQGFLDLTGSAQLSVEIPNLPALLCKPLHVQAVVQSPLGAVRASSVQNFSITM